MDHPKEALEMIRLFLAGKPLSSGKAKIGNRLSDPRPTDCPPPLKQSGSSLPENVHESAGPVLASASLPHPALAREPLPLDEAVLLFIMVAYGQDAPAAPANLTRRIADDLLPDLDFLVTVHHGRSRTRRLLTHKVSTAGPVTEVRVDGLRNGEKYTLVVRCQDRRHQTVSTDDVAVAVTPGCVFEGHQQCCGRGTCVQNSPTGRREDIVATCLCGAGYSGKNCEVDERSRGPRASVGIAESVAPQPDMCPSLPSDIRPAVSQIQNYCDSDNGNRCLLLMEFPVTGSGRDWTWSRVERATAEAYLDSLIGLLRIDFQTCLGTGWVALGSASSPSSRRLTEGQEAGWRDSVLTREFVLSSPSDVVATVSLDARGTDAHPLQVLVLRLRLEGHRDAVVLLVQALEAQVLDPISPFRSGVLTSGIHSVLSIERADKRGATLGRGNGAVGGGGGAYIETDRGERSSQEVRDVVALAAARSTSNLSWSFSTSVIAIVGLLLWAVVRNRREFRRPFSRYNYRSLP